MIRYINQSVTPNIRAQLPFLGLMTDFLLVQAGQVRFTWGNKKLEPAGATRTQYINALRDADKQDYAA